MNKKWTTEEIEYLKELVKSNNFDYRDIGRILERGHRSCLRKALELGLSNNFIKIIECKCKLYGKIKCNSYNK